MHKIHKKRQCLHHNTSRESEPPNKLQISRDSFKRIFHFTYLFTDLLTSVKLLNKEIRNIMSARSKDKVAAMFRRLFRSNKDAGNEGGPSNSASSSAGGSPARRLLRGCRDTVSPADNAPPGSPGFTTAKTATARKDDTAPPSTKTVRARRLMKEFRDLQRYY